MQFVSYSTWEQLPESADTLFAQGARESLFLSRPWFETLSATSLKDDQSLFLACVEDGGRILAILPLIRLSDGNCEPLVTPVTPLYSILMSDSNREEAIACLIDGLHRLPNRVHRFLPIDADDVKMNRIQEAMESRGFDCHRYFRIYNWVHDTKGVTFAQYMAARPGQLRNTIERKSRKLKREHGYHIQLFLNDDLKQALADYHTVFRRSWQGTEHFPGLIPGLVAAMARRGWLRLGVLYIGELPAAAQLWFVAHGKASIFRLAYDRAWRGFSPGSILTSYMMERVLNVDRVEEIDFLTGNDKYKSEWMSRCRKRWVLGCGVPEKPQSPAGRVASSLQKLRGLFNI